MKKMFVVLTALALIFMPAVSEATALQSNQATLTLSFVVNESISVSLSSGSAVFTGGPPTTPSITVTSTWAATASRTLMSTAVWFASSVALTGPGNVNASAVWLSKDGGTYGACTLTNFASTGNACPGVGGDSLFQRVTITGANLVSSQANAFQLQLNPAPTVPGTYTGSILVQSQLSP